MQEPYGTKDMVPKFRKDVEEANLFATFTASLAVELHKLGADVSFENPEGSYLWKLKEFEALLALGWTDVIFDVCMHGAEYKKGTRLRCSPGWVPLLAAKCVWLEDRQQYSCGHTASTGKHPHVVLSEGMPTHQAAEYCDGLVEAWALQIVDRADSLTLRTVEALGNQPLKVCRDSFSGATMESQRERREAENRQCAAGLRNPSHFVTKSGDLINCMQKISEALLKFMVDQPNVELLTLHKCLGKDPSQQPPSEELIHKARLVVCETLGLDSSAASLCHEHSDWRYKILEAVLKAAGDPDRHLVSWLEHGAPGGFSKPVEPGGWFPKVVEAVGATEEDLRCPVSNHPSFLETHGEPAPPGLLLMRATAKAGFAKIYSSQAAAEKVHGKCHPAPLGNLRKPDKAGTGWKDRVLLDLKANRCNELVSLKERVVLPRGIDHAVDMAELGTSRHRAHIFILDYRDAFHWIPLDEAEKRFCCCDLGNRDGFLVMHGMGFGGKAFPLVFCRVVSATARTTQALIQPWKAALQLYMDDPATTIPGDTKDAQLCTAVTILWWRVLGLHLAWKKGLFTQGAHEWIGIIYDYSDQGVTMTVPDHFLHKVLEDVKPWTLAKGSTCISTARSIVGRAERIAQVIPEARPFAASLWAALSAGTQADQSGKGEAPPGHVANRRFASAACWFRALLRGAIFPLQRIVRKKHAGPEYAGKHVITYDASPWGYGATLAKHNVVIGYISGCWEPEVLAKFKATVGDCAFQSLWEHLAGLLAMCTFAPSDCAFTVRGDNLGALNNSLKLKGKGHTLIVAKEMAWRTAAFRWRPLYVHVQGARNVLCDDLSRLYASEPHQFPAVLEHCKKYKAPNLLKIWATWDTVPQD